MLAEALFFYILGAVMLAAALLVVFFRNPVYSAISLIVCFFALAGEYVLLHAHFIAISQVLVYAGAVMVLFLFVIMLMNPRPEDVKEKRSPVPLWGGLLSVIFFITIVIAVISSSKTDRLSIVEEVPVGFGSIENVGIGLFTDYLFPFEAAGVMLLVGIVGVVVLTRSARKDASK